jgi:hypothetical protein
MSNGAFPRSMPNGVATTLWRFPSRACKCLPANVLGHLTNSGRDARPLGTTARPLIGRAVFLRVCFKDRAVRALLRTER